MRLRCAVLLCLMPVLSAGPQQEHKNTSHVRQYPHLDELIAQADALTEKGRYELALNLYASAMEKQPESVVPVDLDDREARSGITRHYGIAEYVRRKIAEWPKKGLDAYRLKYDAIARERFDRAKRNRDLAGLERLRREYPFSSFVDDSMALAANLLLDRGETARAISALEELLAHKTELPKAPLYARLGQAYALAGEKGRLRDLIQSLPSAIASSKIFLGEEEAKLSDFLKDVSRRVQPRRRSPSMSRVPSWPVPAGIPSGLGRVEGDAKPGKRAWSASVELPNFETQSDDWGMRRRNNYNRSYFPLFPAVADGILYVHNEYSIFAYSLFADRPERLWTHREQPPPGELMYDDRVTHTVSVQDGRVFASLITSLGDTEMRMGYIPVKFPFPKRTLFAFDAYGGKVLWKKGGADGFSFPAAPTPDGDRLYVTAVFQKNPTDPFKHIMMCLDARTGETIWETFLASGHTEINLFGNPTRESMGTFAAMAGDTLYYGTNHGAVVAVDKRTGALIWVTRYEQTPIHPTRSVRVSHNSLGWVNTPPIATHGLVIITPTDSPNLYALDQKTGKVRWHIRRARNHRYITGVVGDHLVLGGEQTEIRNIPREGARQGRFNGGMSRGEGKGVVSRDTIYMPTASGVYRIPVDEPDEGRLIRWPDARSNGGNLLIVDGAMILAGPDRVDVYYDRRNVEAGLLEELRKHPRDLALRYRVALRHLQAGREDLAVEELARVILASTGSARPEEVRLGRAARRRLYSISLAQGEKALRRREYKTAESAFSLSREYAPDVGSRIEISIRVADVRIFQDDYAGAVKLLQDLIFNHPDETYRGIRVASYAAKEIGGVLKQVGREAYARFDDEANDLFRKAKKSETPDPFQEIVQRYPNSLAARVALLEAAALYAKQSRFDEAAPLLRQFLRDYAEDPKSLDAHVSLVRILEKKKSMLAAAALLRRMKRLFPERKLDGVPVNKFVDDRLKSDAYKAASQAVGIPVLGTPLKKIRRYEDREFGSGIPLKVAGMPPSGAGEILLMNYGRAVKAIDLKLGDVSWTIRVSAPCRYAAFFDEGLLICTDLEVFRVNLSTGEKSWSHRPGASMRGFEIAGHILLFLSSDRRRGTAYVGAVDAADGSVLWKQGYEGIPRTSAHAAGEHVVFATASPARIHVFELESGRRVSERAPNTPGAIMRFRYVTDDLVVVHSNQRFIEGYSIPSAKMKWRVSLSDFSTEILEVRPEGLFLAGTRRDMGGQRKLFLSRVDLASGKLAELREDIDIGSPRFAALDSDNAYVLTRDPANRSLTLRAFRLKDLKEIWSREIGEPNAALLPLGLSRDHILVPVFERGQNRKYRYSSTLVDKKGRVVQNIRSAFEFERPPNSGLTNDSVLFSVDNLVEVFR